MRVFDTEHSRLLHAEPDDDHYRLLEVAGPGKSQSGWYHVGFPVRWQVGYLTAETFNARLGSRYERRKWGPALSSHHE